MTMFYLKDGDCISYNMLSRNLSTFGTIIFNKILIHLSSHYLPEIYYADKTIKK